MAVALAVVLLAAAWVANLRADAREEPSGALLMTGARSKNLAGSGYAWGLVALMVAALLWGGAPVPYWLVVALFGVGATFVTVMTLLSWHDLVRMDSKGLHIVSAYGTKDVRWQEYRGWTDRGYSQIEILVADPARFEASSSMVERGLRRLANGPTVYVNSRLLRGGQTRLLEQLARAEQLFLPTGRVEPGP